MKNEFERFIDTNGNSRLRVSIPSNRSFSIPYDHDVIPETLRQHKGQGNVINGCLEVTRKEVIAYVVKHGTKRQKEYLGFEK